MIEYGFISAKIDSKVKVVKLKPMRYGPFTIFDKVRNNDFRLEFPSSMQMYSIVNVENLKLYDPTMILDQDLQVQATSLDEFAPEYLNELQEDVILDKKVRYSQREDMEFLHVGMK